MTKALTWLNWILRFAIGALFLFSGFVKAEDILGFSYKLDEYWHVFGMDFMEGSSLFLSWFISVFEMALGIALIVGYRMKLTTWTSMAMMIFFLFLTWYSWWFDAVQDCGCFGDAIKLTPYQTFMKDVILVVLLIPLVWGSFRKATPELFKGRIPAIAAIGSFVLFGAFSYWSYQHLPPIDFRPYKIGANVYECTTPLESNNYEPHCHDYAPIGLTCGNGEMYAEFKGPVLLVVSTSLTKADPEDITASVELANSLTQGGDPVVYGLTATTTTDLNQVKSEYKIPYCMAQGDETVNKTIIRSSPGYVLMKDGIVLQKWHHNDIPDAEEVRSFF